MNETLNIIDPRKTVGLKDVVRRTGIPRSTIMKWLAEDEQAGKPGRQFPKPLPGHKLRWNVAGFVRMVREVPRWGGPHEAVRRATASTAPSVPDESRRTLGPSPTSMAPGKRRYIRGVSSKAVADEIGRSKNG
jgi:predicted DNA-binding transcriptional regulator AlpA